MPPMIIPGWLFLGRPVKPVAFGLMVVSLAFAWANGLTSDLLGQTPHANVIAIYATASSAMLFWGWLGRSEKASEWGLIMTFGLFMLRGIFLLLLYGPGLFNVYSSLGTAIIAAGSYLLETSDPHEIKPRQGDTH